MDRLRLSPPSAWVLLLALVLFFCAWAAQAQDLPPTSETPELYWRALLPLIMNLPANFDSYQANLLNQVESLQTSNESLTQTNKDLQTSNADLQSSNASLTESLKRSEARAATSENRSAQLQTALDASIGSIIQAEAKAVALERERNLWRIGAVGGGLAALVVIIYAVLK